MLQIEMNEIAISELYDGYVDKGDDGVVAYGGKLDIRPAYQRAFVYGESQSQKVIDTILKGLPLNTMYWSESEDGSYELMDGQQRTLAICQYLHGDFSIDSLYFCNLPEDERQKILNYKLSIYICKGTNTEKIDWFATINVASSNLYAQEIRNAIYIGPWLTDAKKHFCKTKCAAYQLASKYINGNTIRQDYLQTALAWISHRDNTSIEGYMAQHQQDANCNELWAYFTDVITWVEMLFPKSFYRPIMKGQPWGEFYNLHHDSNYDALELENEVKALILDDEVSNNRGIYSYLFSGDEKFLCLKGFSEKERVAQYEIQNGVCPICGKHFTYDEMDAIHFISWRDGGKTTPKNIRMVCKWCNKK